MSSFSLHIKTCQFKEHCSTPVFLFVDHDVYHIHDIKPSIGSFVKHPFQNYLPVQYLRLLQGRQHNQARHHCQPLCSTMLLVHPFNVDGTIASEKMERMNYKDADGEPLVSCLQQFSDLEVARMIRHTIISAKAVGVQPRLVYSPQQMNNAIFVKLARIQENCPSWF
ncbi:hypothetical protein I7I48_03988 [Histoplasma ohiense]|nr:hypothetical protein I7I48_03988 [Histoplasma ohiense (nom. inval.)]